MASVALNPRSTGRLVFAATLVAVGIWGLIAGDFAPIWQPVRKDLPAREILVYLCVAVSLTSGLGLFWRRSEAAAARVLFVYLLLWMLWFKGPDILRAPTVEGPYQACGEIAVIVAGAWVLYAWLAADWDRRRLGFAVGASGVRAARVLYGLALIAFGLSHFVYVELTAPLVPGWLGSGVFWAYFTGATYLAAALGVLTGVYARLAAVLAALQMGLFLLLVWVPILASGNTSAFNWSETALTWALTAGAWVVADSYRGKGWRSSSA